MSKGLEELKRLAYENACCRCQYYTNNKCTNKDKCVWKIIETELKALKIIKDEFDISFNDSKQEITFQSIEQPYTHMRFSLTRKIEDKSKYDLLKEVLK